MSRPVVTLTTDFGQADAYVGTMKGVILGICPEATLVDICHEIRPQNVRQAAYVFSTAVPYFPSGPGTVHVVVVDPGVGSSRRPIAVLAERATYVAPDNGVLSLALAWDPACLAVHLTDSRYRLRETSATFHGRDIFAPAAAHLACGADPRDMGDQIPLSNLVTLSLPEPSPLTDGWWQGEVIHVDGGGNLVTSFRSQGPDAQAIVQIRAQQVVGISQTFSDVESGKLVAYTGSSGHLEIAVRDGSAAARLHVDIGLPVLVKRTGLPASETGQRQL